jgi:ribosomal protein L44E
MKFTCINCKKEFEANIDDAPRQFWKGKNKPTEKQVVSLKCSLCGTESNYYV